MEDVEMSHHSPQMRHSDLTQPYTNSNQNETETKPAINLPEEIFGLAGDLTRFELRGDSFHKPRPFNFQTTAPAQSYQYQNGHHHSNNDSFFSNIEVPNVFTFQEGPATKFAFDNRRSGEIDSIMVDNGLSYMGAHNTINN